ncbi:ATP-dependent RNA helicase DbpA [Lacimicrobium alkaliphilum]|uniref:ATP-dependent RNA helicase DbpA n=1 Tax=Lacimicrobium alkaliphilum TaxID=1526571 RepID=A0ABQ1QWV8_9ALTE|nr:ATP-dependent RNA helicase DbpA [Lacimicrobium alkaliphilum]GGD48976.1 ATP-dependent RNA helicase DbpA [Lacimicrobium alkaliphilum]
MHQAFSSLSLPQPLLENLDSLRYQVMTPIQAASLPFILQGRDVIAQASTGSGKTVAFSIGLLLKVDEQDSRVQALVLCPTRELADQVSTEIRRLARYKDNLKVLTLYGGVPMASQVASLRHGAQVVVGTPGRTLDHMLRRNLDLGAVSTLVLDEADRMLDMGFAEEIAAVTTATPKQRQTLLFSATYPAQIARISADIQRDPEQVKVESLHDAGSITQRSYEVTKDNRLATAQALLTHFSPKSAIVFCNSRIDCQQLAETLCEKGFSAAPLHGDMEQVARQEVLIQFASRSLAVLVATDVAARGLDIEDVELVLNYQVSADPEVHVHRIGRTGRAGNKGLALTLCSPEEVKWAAAVEEYQQQKFNWSDASKIRFKASGITEPLYRTLRMDAGKKQKIRPGDILGALTKDADISGDDIGKITLAQNCSYVAVKMRSVKRALAHFREGKLKGKRVRARKL